MSHIWQHVVCYDVEDVEDVEDNTVPVSPIRPQTVLYLEYISSTISHLNSLSKYACSAILYHPDADPAQKLFSIDFPAQMYKLCLVGTTVLSQCCRGFSVLNTAPATKALMNVLS